MTATPTTSEDARGPTAYSYVRFSTSKQLLGDSLRRQVEACENYCREHNLKLHPVSYRDLGVSAFKRNNVERGALAAFISACKAGKIKKGSYLIIEQFDRLSRDETDTALELLLDLIKRCGIIVVTLVDKKVWDREAIKDTGNLVLAIVFMSRAHNESAAKADRLRSVWGRKKLLASGPTSSGRIVTSECPRWLTPNDDKTGFEPIPERVESIKKVFEMRIGGYGISSIVTRANEEKWPVAGKRAVRKPGEAEDAFELRKQQGMTWHTSTVGRLLRNRALLGEYQPHENDRERSGKRSPVGNPIKDYYPVVIDEETFLRAEAKANRSGRFPGRRDASLKNWLQGLLQCSCGQSFVRKNKNSLAQPGYSRYYCVGRNRGVTRCPGSSALELENAVLTVVSTAAPQYLQGTKRMTELKAQHDLLQVELDAATNTRDRYLDAIGSTSLPIEGLTSRLAEANAKLRSVEAKFNEIRASIADMSCDYDTVFSNILKSVRSVDSLDARAALREDLSRVIERCVIHQADGFMEVYLRGNPKPLWQPLDVDATVAAANQISSPDSTDSAEPFQPYPYEDEYDQEKMPQP